MSLLSPEASAHLFPRTNGGGIFVVGGTTAGQFTTVRLGNRHRLCICGDAVPQVFDQLDSLRQGERQEFASCCVCHRKSLANSHLFAKSPYDDGDPDPIRGRAKLAERLPLRGPQTRDFQIRRLGGQSKFMSASYRNSNLQTKCSQPAKCVTSCMNFGALVDGVGTPALE